MAKFYGSKPNTGLAILGWLLSTCGFGILLGGVAAMQQACGGAAVNSAIPPGMGAVGYLAAVPCDRFFSFDWYVSSLHPFFKLTMCPCTDPPFFPHSLIYIYFN